MTTKRELELEISRHADERLAAADESIRLGADYREGPLS
jgi:hypothetical protein